MRSILKKIPIATKKQFELVNITDETTKIVAESGIFAGMAVIFCPHTTAGIRLNHDESLLAQDIMKAVYRLVPMDISYGHDLFEVRQNIAPNERSNGNAHVKAFLLGSSETLIVEQSRLLLGARQSIFFVELDGARSREVWIRVMGE